jgi:hypothetical protein
LRARELLLCEIAELFYVRNYLPLLGSVVTFQVNFSDEPLRFLRV